MKVQKNTSRTGNREMSLRCFQGVLIIKLAFSSSQEANAMLSLNNGWLEWPGEVQLQSSIFELGR